MKKFVKKDEREAMRYRVIKALGVTAKSMSWWQLSGLMRDLEMDEIRALARATGIVNDPEYLYKEETEMSFSNRGDVTDRDAENTKSCPAPDPPYTYVVCYIRKKEGHDPKLIFEPLTRPEAEKRIKELLGWNEKGVSVLDVRVFACHDFSEKTIVERLELV